MLEIGSLIDGKYKILSVVGHGGMSTVYMAINEKANKTWAIKEVRKDGMVNFEAVRQGLVTEANILKKLKHPHLPSIVDVIEDSQTFLIVMDYIEGRTLSETLKEQGAQRQELVIQWAEQLCDVLGYLHSRNPAIIYRDMKPSNIMLKPDGNLMVFDFGTAREFKSKNQKDTTCLGTVGYAAPEQYGNLGQTDARTDIYCLGATLYHLVTGKDPSEPPYEIKPIRQVNPALSSGLEQILLKCTQRDPNDRYQSDEELMYALQHYELIDEQYRKRQKRRLKTFIATVACAAVFALGGLVLHTTADKLGADTYKEMLDDAKQTSDYNDKVDIYEQCTKIPGKAGEEKAYLELMDAYEEDDVFSVSEANQIERLVKTNREALQENPQSYAKVCYKLGKLFWYHYDYGSAKRITNAQASVQWFDSALESIENAQNAPQDDPDNKSDKDQVNPSLARAYAGIGSFYRDIGIARKEAEDKGMYKPLYENMYELIDTIASNPDENEVIRLELLSMGLEAISTYASKFKNDGVTKEEMMKLYEAIAKNLGKDNDSDSAIKISDGDELAEKKAYLDGQLAQAKNDIELAYATGGGN